MIFLCFYVKIKIVNLTIYRMEVNTMYGAEIKLSDGHEETTLEVEIYQDGRACLTLVRNKGKLGKVQSESIFFHPEEHSKIIKALKALTEAMWQEGGKVIASPNSYDPEHVSWIDPDIAGCYTIWEPDTNIG
jgi:hypothetical protein